MYYYGYSGGQGYGSPCCPGTYVGNTCGGYGLGAALWIVLFILLVIIIGAGWSWGGHRDIDHC
ncbi:MAG: YjcZ family sporulation protein [Bacilli bacterium]|nr:YjcZ family sporulation protein [Bacilli bacterium]